MRQTTRGLVVWFGLLLASSFLFGQGEELAKLLTQASPGVISIVAYGKDKQEIGKGSAVVLTEKLAATSYHLVSQAANCVGFNFRKKEVDVDGIVAVDKSLDLALLQINGKVQILPQATTDEFAENKKVFGIGSNESGEIIIADGAIRQAFDISASQKVWDSSLAIPDTFTGGAIVDASGKILGMIVVMDKRLRFVVPMNVIAGLPKTAKLTPMKSWQPDDYMPGLEAAWLAGRLYHWQGDSFNAQKNLEKVVKANPGSLEAWTILASVYDGQRDYANAVSAYKKVIELDPKRVRAYSTLGQILIRMQKASDAAPQLEKAIELEPGNKEAALSLANAYQDMRDFPKAADAYEKYLSLKPENPWEAYRQLGVCRSEAKQYDAAVAAFSEALKHDPKNVSLNYNLAQAYEKAGTLDKAEESYKLLAEIDAKSAVSYYGLILNMYDKAGQPLKAVEAARKLVALKPTKSETDFYNIGYEYVKAQKYPEAIEAFKQALAINPNYDVAYFQIGLAYYQMKRYKDAVEPFKRNVALVADNVYGWLYLGMSYMQVKDFNSALDPIKKASDLQPDNGTALFNLAVVYLNLKDNFSAREVYRRLTTVDANLAAKLRPLLR